jgi:RimJ/RimL family protein N-acetyltransferase
MTAVQFAGGKGRCDLLRIGGVHLTITDEKRLEIIRCGEGLPLQTSIPGIELRALRRDDAAAYHELVQRNREHLTQYGDYHELVSSTLEDIADELALRPERKVRTGIWRRNELMGRADLGLVDAPGAMVLGYWIGAEYTGNGYATAACRTLLDYGWTYLHATDFWAGVTHGNEKSIAVLERLGFAAVARLERHTRFHLGVSA